MSERWDGDEQEANQRLDRPSAFGLRSRLVSFSMPAPGATAVALLQQAKGRERFFWEDVRDHTTFAGFGVAANLMAWGDNRIASIQEQAQRLFATAVVLNSDETLAAPRLFGGFAFRDDFTPDNAWSVFHPAHFILPHYQLVQMQDQSWLTINALIPADEDPNTIRAELSEALTIRAELLASAPPISPTESHPQPAQISYPMPFDTWGKMINQARDEIGQGHLKKVVLSRVCELRFDEPVDVDGALDYLHVHYADCYRFLFEPRPHHAFYGATPELLAKVNGRTITTMALAGSIGRGKNTYEDDVLGNTLLESVKDRHEHELVVQSILSRLAPLTSKLEIAPAPGLYKLSNIQHLYSPVRGTLLDKMGILPLIDVLHPTPALGGSPRLQAMRFIQEAEPVPRGWYGAPMGWIDVNLDGAFAVGIRSAVAQDRRAWLYAGAGIVADSLPEKEWEETALKFRPMLNALGHAI